MPIISLTHSRGVSLIEVLVAVVVLSIGLLGLAGLQATGLRTTTSAYERSQAVFLANNMADRIRANTDRFGIVQTAVYDNVTSPGGGTSCFETGCAGSDAIAAADLLEWYEGLSDLSSGTGRIIRDNSAGYDVWIVTVMWDDARTGATGTGCDPSNTNDLTCFSLQVRP